MHSEFAEFRDFSARKVRRDRGVARAQREVARALAELSILRRRTAADHSGMSHAIHSPSCLRSLSDGAGLSGGMLVLVAAGPDAVVSSI
jgi:hypothetical protein